MDKITVKDIKKHLSLKTRIKITGRNLHSLGKKWVSGVKKASNKFKEFIGEEAIEAKIDEKKAKKEAKIDTKRNELKQFIGAMEQDDEYRIGKGTYYLKEVKNELRKLDKKRMNVPRKGLGVFALAELTLTKIKSNAKIAWANHREKVNEKKREKEIENQKIKLAENLKEQLRLQNEARAIVEKYPEELNVFVNDLMKTYNSQQLENTESNVKTI